MPPAAKRALIWLLVILVFWFILTNPVKAGADGQSIMHGLKSAGNSLATFVGSL